MTDKDKLIVPNISFEDWYVGLLEVAGEHAYIPMDPADWREFYDDWYTPSEAWYEDQSYD